MVDLTACTLNVRNTPDLPRAQVRHDLAAVRDLAGIHLWQEIAEADDRDDLRHCLPAEQGWQHVELDTEDPISLNRRFVVLEHGQKFMHAGLDGISPARYATYAIVRRSRKLAPFAIVNTHTVSRPFDTGADRAEWRKTMWHQHRRRMVTLIDELLTEGHSVLVGGDFNATSIGQLHPGQRPIIRDRLDHLLWINAAGGAHLDRVTRKRRLGTDHLFTDHPALIARLTLT